MAATILYVSSASAVSSQIDKFVCVRQSGGPMASFTLTINFDTKNIDVSANSGIQPD